MKRSQFNMRVKPEFMEEIENWRAKQRPIPSASEAIVTLCMRAIRAEYRSAQDADLLRCSDPKVQCTNKAK
jgi:hypothetical protein